MATTTITRVMETEPMENSGCQKISGEGGKWLSSCVGATVPSVDASTFKLTSSPWS